ncbi:MAG: NUDIX hydrolase [Clostridia bacterium]|jgi:ADP-ribose pyrophosphatase
MSNKPKIEDIKKITDNKWVNLYKTTYNYDQKENKEWIFASRKDNDLKKIDAVVIVPIVQDNNETKICCIKEFRIPINDYEWGFPAGLIENNEDIEEAVKRELKEETGLDFIQTIYITNEIFSSSGLTDESVLVYFVEAEGEISLEFKEENEDIECFMLNIKDIKYILKNKKFKIGAKAWGILWAFCQIGEIKIKGI